MKPNEWKVGMPIEVVLLHPADGDTILLGDTGIILGGASCGVRCSMTRLGHAWPFRLEQIELYTSNVFDVVPG